MVHQPHDALVKAALSRPENAIGALKAALPAELLAQLELSTLRLSQDSFVDEHLAKLYSDLVYEVQVAGRPGFVCFVLHEHQSTVDSMMIVRVLIYLAHAWAYWLETHPGAERVPAIIPVVLYHGEKPWDAPTSLRKVLDLPEAGILAAGDLLPSLSFVLDDLRRVSDADVRARELGVFGRLTLLLLKHGRSLVAGRRGPGSLEAFLREVDDLLQLLPDRADRVRAFCYIIEVVEGADPEALATALDPAATQEVRQDAMTAAEKLRQEGEVAGIAKGAIQGQRRLLLRQLRTKFGSLAPDVEARVGAADEASLEAWGDALLTATRVEDVWGGA